MDYIVEHMLKRHSVMLIYGVSMIVFILLDMYIRRIRSTLPETYESFESKFLSDKLMQSHGKKKYYFYIAKLKKSYLLSIITTLFVLAFYMQKNSSMDTAVVFISVYFVFTAMNFVYGIYQHFSFVKNYKDIYKSDISESVSKKIITLKAFELICFFIIFFVIVPITILIHGKKRVSFL